LAVAEVANAPFKVIKFKVQKSFQWAVAVNSSRFKVLLSAAASYWNIR